MATERVRALESDVKRESGAALEATKETLSLYYNVLAYMNQELGLAPEVKKYSLKTLELQPHDIIRSLQATEALQILGDFPQAIAIFDEILSAVQSFNVRALFLYRREIAFILYTMWDVPLSIYSMDSIVDSRIKNGKGTLFGHTSEFVDMATYTSAWQDAGRTRKLHHDLISSGLIAHPDAQPHGDPVCNDIVVARIREALSAAAPLRAVFQPVEFGFRAHFTKIRALSLGALDMAQTLRRHARCLALGYDGLFVSAASSSSYPHINADDFASRRLTGFEIPSVCAKEGIIAASNFSYRAFGWRDFFDIGVRYRQFADFSDNVWWHDNIWRFVSDEALKNGFSTPITSGMLFVSKYRSYFDASFHFLKSEMAHGYYDNRTKTLRRLSHSQKLALEKAQTLNAVYNIVLEPFYVVGNCKSLLNRSLPIKCTKLSLDRPTDSEGFDFRIATEVSEEKFKSLSAEIDSAFKSFVDSLVKLRFGKRHEGYKPSVEEAAEKIMDAAYYWIHLSPLSRGSAAMGLLSVVASYLSLGFCVSGRLPPKKQLDWEAFFTSDPIEFRRKTMPWFTDIVVPVGSASCASLDLSWLDVSDNSATSSRPSSLDRMLSNIFSTIGRISKGLSVEFEDLY
jgi:tetratricopeptide (TPR) repeat protein